MACSNAYGSSSEVALFYITDPGTAQINLADQTIEWQQVRMIGESMDLSLSSTISEEITPQRSYSNSKLTQGNITGGFNFEASARFLDNWLMAAVQGIDETGAAYTPTWIGGSPASTNPWTANGDKMYNGSAKNCFAILKRVALGDGTNYDWYVFRYCQVSSMTITAEPGALITGSVSLMGTEGEVIANSATGAAGWTFQDDYSNPLMSGVDSLTGLELQSSVGSDLGIIFQNFSLTMDNQLREQFGVGTGSIYAAGVASGRFMATMDASAYYSNPTIFQNFVADNELKIVFSLTDANGDGWGFLFDKVKVTGGSTPQAGGPDQDLMISSTFQAFESDTKGTVEINMVEVS